MFSHSEYMCCKEIFQSFYESKIKKRNNEKKEEEEKKKEDKQ